MRYKEITEGDIGPHSKYQGNELVLMMLGKKPAALITSRERHFNEFIKLKNERKIVGFKTHWDYPDGESMYAFALPHHVDNAKEIIKIYNKKQPNKDPNGPAFVPELTKDEHVALGTLLGYSNDDIKTFLASWYK